MTYDVQEKPTKFVHVWSRNQKDFFDIRRKMFFCNVSIADKCRKLGRSHDVIVGCKSNISRGSGFVKINGWSNVSQVEAKRR